MMLGVAYQLGFIPLTYNSIQWSIRHAVGREFERNYRAFNIGRKIVLRPDLFGVSAPKEIETVDQAVERKSNILKATAPGARPTPRNTRPSARPPSNRCPASMTPPRRDYVIRLFDAIQWGTLKYGRQYASRIVKTYQQDTRRGDRRFAVTRAVIWNLAKVMMIKDEVYVSMLYTSPEKYKRDRRRFNVNPANGDSIFLPPPQPTRVRPLAADRIRFHWKGRYWQYAHPSPLPLAPQSPAPTGTPRKRPSASGT